MPLVRIEIIKGKTNEYKRAVLDEVHAGLVRALHIEDWDRFQRLIEIEDSIFERSEDKTDCFMIIEITMFKGRTKEQKADIYKEITEGLRRRLGIAPTDVFIVINEPPDENWGLAGSQRG